MSGAAYKAAEQSFAAAAADLVDSYIASIQVTDEWRGLTQSQQNWVRDTLFSRVKDVLEQSHDVKIATA